MSQWTFVFAAYGLVGLSTIGLVGRSYLVMRQAEAEAEAAKHRR
jgi:hypothetical protein